MIKKFNILKEAFFKKQTGDTGAFAKSSRYVLKRVLKLIKNKPLNQIIEYGPGDGAMTKELLKHLSPNGKLLAVEINPKFLEILRKITDSRLQVVDGQIQDVSENIKNYNFNKVDLVVSSIPFSWLSKAEQEKVVRATKKVLINGGMFIVFHQYSNIMHKPLKKIFNEAKTRFEFRNFFPCFIISAIKSPLKK